MKKTDAACALLCVRCRVNVQVCLCGLNRLQNQDESALLASLAVPIRGLESGQNRAVSEAMQEAVMEGGRLI